MQLLLSGPNLESLAYRSRQKSHLWKTLDSPAPFPTHYTSAAQIKTCSLITSTNDKETESKCSETFDTAMIYRRMIIFQIIHFLQHLAKYQSTTLETNNLLTWPYNADSLSDFLF